MPAIKVAAVSSFNTTTPSNAAGANLVVGFRPEPDGRGTLGILLACLAVLLLNTWTVFHPNIPPLGQRERRLWLHKFKCFASAVAAPDAIAAMACSQWRYARRATKELQPLLPWWTMQHSFYAEMGGYRVLDKSTGQILVFRTPQLAWLQKQRLIIIPELPKKEIDDKSKGDGIAKTLACVQSLWFLISCSARFQQHLPLTTLEIELLPYVAITWMVYIFWWKKPLQVATYTLIEVAQMTVSDLVRLSEATCPVDRAPYWWRPVPVELHARGWEFFWMEKPWNLKRFSVINTTHLIPSELHKRVRRTMAESVVADWYRNAVNECHPSEWDCWDDVVIYATGVFVLGIPLIAWNYHFPTDIERILWRTAALTSIGAVTVWVPVAFLLRWLKPGNVWRELPYYVLTSCVGLARVYIIVEVLVGLRNVPATVYDTVNWSQYIPHIF